ncbi:MAG: F0F1 ATP synthase subunit delta [Anaerolineales bacterium]|nr:F0F1 ATP synthase subunit delta [Anaerolineales bacterium]
MLSIDIPTIVFEILNFVVLSVLLYHFLFKPVIRSVRERAEEKAALMKAAQEELAEAERYRMELEARLKQADEQISIIVNEAQDRLEDTRAVIISSARKEAERILREASLEVRQQQQKAMSDHVDELMAAIKKVSGQVIFQAAPPEVHDNLVQQLNDRIWQLGSKEMDQVEAIRRSLDERSPTVFVEAAHDLHIRHQQELMRTLTALIDRDVELELKTNPELILGIRVRVGDTIINNSIASQLDEILEEAAKTFKDNLTYA